MKRLSFIVAILFLSILCGLNFAEDTKAKVILLISEQNIEGPQRAWWASEIDLSSTEATIAKRLIEQGYEVVEPSVINKIIGPSRAFRMINLSKDKSVDLGTLTQADYVVLGKAIASTGSKVPQSNMVSCFANLTAKLIRVKDGKVIAYIDAYGNSAHMDAITGGKEALVNASQNLAQKIIQALNKEGGK